MTINKRLKVLDLFAGIGGFSLGLERAGMETTAFCEINPFCQATLSKHWPDVPLFKDVKTMEYKLHEYDVITAGFPCQDISLAGKGAGLKGTRSSLWWQVRRAIRLVRPQYVILENVSALLYRGLGTVLGSLAKIGYDAEWHCLPAAHFGAPHQRDRIWIVAYPRGQRKQRCFPQTVSRQPAFSWCQDVRRVADLPERSTLYPSQLCRSRHGISQRLDALGNAVIPQIPELIAREIIFSDEGL